MTLPRRRRKKIFENEERQIVDSAIAALEGAT
jgi:hypothetical protein